MNSKKFQWGHVVSTSLWCAAVLVWLQAHLNKFNQLSGIDRYTEAILILQNTPLFFLFAMRRPAEKASWHPADLMSAFLGSCMPSLFWPAPHGSANAVGLILISLGAVLTLIALISIGRSWGVIPANRKVQTSGMYRFVRHPVYAGYQIFNAGYVLNEWSVYNLSVAILCLVSQMLRIHAEERLLSQDPVYAEYKQKVRWRLIPFLY